MMINEKISGCDRKSILEFIEDVYKENSEFEVFLHFFLKDEKNCNVVRREVVDGLNRADELSIRKILGLKDDFFHFMETMDLQYYYWTIYQWMKTHVRNLNHAIEPSEKKELNVELLEKLGLKREGRACKTIMKRLKNSRFEKCMEPYRWVSKFIKDEFKSDPILSDNDSDYPFEDSFDKFYKLDDTIIHDNFWDINIINLKKEDWNRENFLNLIREKEKRFG